MQMTQMNKTIRKQIKGINKQVRQVNKGLQKGIDRNYKGLQKGIDRNFNHFGQTRSAGPGLFTGLLLISIPVVAGVLLLGKNGAKNREMISQYFKPEQTTEKQTDKQTTQQTSEPILGKLQHQFTSFVEQLGFGKPQQAEKQVAGQKNGHKNGKSQAEQTAGGNHIQTMGEV